MSLFIIAEAGINHNGDIGIAKQLIDMATEAGADSMCSRNIPPRIRIALP